MKIHRSASSLVAVGALALAAVGMASSAQAGDVYWSIGVNSPGLQVGVANGAPMVLMQPPIYSQPYPYPVYREPRVVYRQPRVIYEEPRQVVYVRQAPVFIAQPQYVRSEWKHRGHRHGKDRFESRHFDDRGSRHRGRGHNRD